MSAERRAPAIALEGAGKRYGERQALEPVTLSVERGESVVLVGPSGAGKTTLLRTIAGSLAPDAGRVALHGRELSELGPGPELARLVGVVAQQFDLVANLSAIQNVLAGRLGTWGFWRSLASLVVPRDREIALDALDRVGLRHLAYERAGRLSGGEQQRVAVARVLVQAPAVIIADEPVASLDPARAEQVLGLLSEAVRERGETLVASVHGLAHIRAHFGRIVGLRNGRVAFDIPTNLLTEERLAQLYAIDGLRPES